MRYYNNTVLEAIELPIRITEFKTNKKLKYLFKKVSDFKSGHQKIHFLLTEDYTNLTAYIPVFTLLLERVEKIEQDYGVKPYLFDTGIIINNEKWTKELWETEKRIIVRSINTSDKKIRTHAPLPPNNFTSSVFTGFKNKNFTLSYSDSHSVLFISPSGILVDNLFKRCTINDIKVDKLFKRCRVDYNTCWDNTSNIVVTNHNLLGSPEIFSEIFDAKPIASIIITYDALDAFFRQLESNDQSEDDKLECLWQTLLSFSSSIGHPNIIVTAPSEKSLIIRKHIEYINYNDQILNGYNIGFKDILLEGDFNENKPIPDPIKGVLKFQEKDNMLFNIMNGIKNNYSILCKEIFYDIENYKKLRSLFYRLNTEIYSLLPLHDRLERLSDRFIELISSLRLPKQFESITESLIADLHFLKEHILLCEFGYEYNNTMQEINGNCIAVLTDNDVDLKNEHLDQAGNKVVAVNKFTWESARQEIIINKTVVIAANLLNNGKPQNNVYDKLFSLILNQWSHQCRIYLLMSASNLMTFRALTLAFENCINILRDGNHGSFVTKQIIDIESIDKAVAQVQHEKLTDINNIIESQLLLYTQKSFGVRPSRYKREGHDIDKVTIHFEGDECMENIPALRLFYILPDNIGDEGDDDDEKNKKYAQDLEPGDKIIVIFDDRGSTYQDIRELLIERNVKDFRRLYEKGQVWLDVLADYKERFGTRALRTKLIEKGMVPVVTATINNWLNDRNILPDNFNSIIQATRNLIIERQDLYAGKHHLIGNVDSYVNSYMNTYRTPRLLYQSILKKVKNNEGINYSIREYRDIFNELTEKARILTVTNVE